MNLAVTFEPDPARVQELRRHVADALVEAVPLPARESIVLLASELVTNAIVHARPPYQLRLVQDRGVVRLAVSDGGGPGAIVVQAPGPTDLGGRGLYLVDALATGWGVDERPGLRTVWFEVRY
jgi:anti-sigma regulatory factor (Ser/Thr protein kinase)